MAMLRPTSDLKDSGIEWYGTCPVSWNKAPLYSALTEINQKNDPVVTTNILSLTNTEGVIPYSERGNQGNKSKEKFEEYKVVYPNTIVANSMNILIGSVGLSAYEGCVSPVYYIYKAKPQYDIRYMNYLFSMELFQKRLRQFANGIMEIRLRVSSHDILHQNVMMPSYEEQRAISDYLDDRCSKIDEIIAEATASIEEYKELKQAVIANAVLYGLGKKVPVKETDENWCPRIPVHWRFERGRYLFRETNIRSVDGSEELLTVSQYTGITPRSMKNVTMFEATSLVDYKICEIGDIAANTMWMWAGAVGVSGYYGVISPSYNTYRQLKGDYDSKYLDYLLRAAPLVSEYESLSTGIRASRLRLYPSQFLSIRYPVPPIDEQKGIVEYLDRKVNDIDALISEKQALIDDLQAYKKSLIYEVVTGKRRVV